MCRHRRQEIFTISVCLYSNILIIINGSLVRSNVMSVQRDGKCLFLAVSYCIHLTEDRDFGIRLITDKKIINDLERIGEGITMNLSLINSFEVYKNLFS